jgi:hypothetical protein
VKEPLKLPFFFLFILLCVTFACAALQVLAGWGLADGAARAFSASLFIQRLPRAVVDVIIPSVVLTLVLVGFRMARHPFSRFLGLLIVLAMGYVTLVNGMLWFRRLAGATVVPAAATRQYLVPGTFTQVGSLLVAVNAVADPGVTGILRVDPAGRAGTRLAVYGSGVAAARAGSLSITTAGRPAVTISGSAEPAWTSLFAPDRFSAAFLRDIGTVTGDYERLLSRSLPEFFAASFALVFLCSASLVLLRLTRWPLANVMLMVIAVRGWFSLYHLLAVNLAPRIGALITDALAARLAAPAAFMVIGVILLLIDVLFVPADRWTRPEAA